MRYLRISELAMQIVMSKQFQKVSPGLWGVTAADQTSNLGWVPVLSYLWREQGLQDLESQYVKYRASLEFLETHRIWVLSCLSPCPLHPVIDGNEMALIWPVLFMVVLFTIFLALKNAM